jgi:hypothetical protein
MEIECRVSFSDILLSPSRPLYIWPLGDMINVRLLASSTRVSLLSQSEWYFWYKIFESCVFMYVIHSDTRYNCVISEGS